jgi:hypothetical protein
MNYSIYSQQGSQGSNNQNSQSGTETDRIKLLLDKMSKEREQPDEFQIDPTMLNQFLSSGSNLAQQSMINMAQPQSNTGAAIGAIMGQLGGLMPKMPRTAGPVNDSSTPDESGGTIDMPDSQVSPTMIKSEDSIVNQILGKIRNSPLSQIYNNPGKFVDQMPITQVAKPMYKAAMPVMQGLGSAAMSGMSGLGSMLGRI